MEQRLSRYLIVVPLIFGMQAIGGDQNTDVDLLNKNIELTDGTEPHTKMDAESAQRILAHFASPKGRWEHFLGKIRKGEKGTIVTALLLIEFSSSEMQQELNFALQETLITTPDVVLDANVKANTPQKWICGKPAYENYDLATHLNDERIAALELLLAAMDSPDKEMRQLYDRKLKSVAEACLETLRISMGK